MVGPEAKPSLSRRQTDPVKNSPAAQLPSCRGSKGAEQPEAVGGGKGDPAGAAP